MGKAQEDTATAAAGGPVRLLATLFLLVAIVNAAVATCDHVWWPLALTTLGPAFAPVLERRCARGRGGPGRQPRR